MAQRIKNPEGFLMMTSTAVEATIYREKFTCKCEKCGSISRTLCFIAAIDEFTCPSCMRSFVYLNTHSLTKEEIERYNKLANINKLPKYEED